MSYTRTVQEALAQRISDVSDAQSRTMEVFDVNDLSGPVTFFRKVSLRPERKSQRVSIKYAKDAVSSDKATALLKDKVDQYTKVPEETIYRRAMEKLGSDPRNLRRKDSIVVLNTERVFTNTGCKPCVGRGTVNCATCGGTAVVYCRGCGGYGQHTCSCGGSGRVQRFTNNQVHYDLCGGCGGVGRNTCSGCGGHGRIVCTHCHRGQVTCGACDGDGSLVHNHWVEINADLTDGFYRYPRSLPWVNDVLKIGSLVEHVVGDYKPIGLFSGDEHKPGYWLKLDATAYTTDATLKLNEKEAKCRLVGLGRTVVEDGNIGSELFEGVLSKMSVPGDIDAFSRGVSYPLSSRLIGTTASPAEAVDIKSLSDVKTKLITEDQARRFFSAYRSGFKSQVQAMGRISPASLVRNALSYFWRLLLLLLIPMIYSHGNPMDNLNAGIVGLVRGQGGELWLSGIFQYLDHGGLLGDSMQLLAAVAFLSTFTFRKFMGFRFNRWISAGLFGRLWATFVLTAFFVMLLALFPSNICAFDWHRYLPTLDMLRAGATATAAAAPTVFALSVLLGLLFNRSLNYPGTYRKLLKMGYSEDVIDRLILSNASAL